MSWSWFYHRTEEGMSVLKYISKENFYIPKSSFLNLPTFTNAFAAPLLSPSSFTRSPLPFPLLPPLLFFHSQTFFVSSLPFILTSLHHSHLRLHSTTSRLFLFVLYVSDDEFQICNHCSSCAKFMLSITWQSASDSQWNGGAWNMSYDGRNDSFGGLWSRLS